MKSAQDPRHVKRRKVIKELFASSYSDQKIGDRTKLILSKKNLLDKKIEKAAVEWPINKLNKIDLAILRLAVFELSEEKNPEKVVIDEAIELAKEYGSENSAGFVNGVLGAIVKQNTK